MRRIVWLILALTTLTAQAQERIHVRMRDYNTYWDFPYVTTDIDHFDFSADRSLLRALRPDGVPVPFHAAKVDSVTFEDEPLEETKNHYRVFQLYVTTNDGKDIVSREAYVPCPSVSTHADRSPTIRRRPPSAGVATRRGAGTTRSLTASSSMPSISCWDSARPRVGCCWPTTVISPT